VCDGTNVSVVRVRAKSVSFCQSSLVLRPSWASSHLIAAALYLLLSNRPVLCCHAPGTILHKNVGVALQVIRRTHGYDSNWGLILHGVSA
jgi:hypothetical protein